jgi:negative regulator of sigma-B (phosphoserine phosphatase)
VTPIAAHASRPKPGEVANGDRAFFFRVDDARHVAGVVDGLGHGPRAEEAALRAVETVEANAGAAIDDLFEIVHKALRGTRGAALTLITVEGDALAAGGVGNVALRVLHGPTTLGYVATPGIVGGQMRGVRVSRARLDAQTRIVVHSDGISSRFPSEPFGAPPLEVASARLLAEHAGSLDDATVLVLDITPDRRPVSGAPPVPRR